MASVQRLRHQAQASRHSDDNRAAARGRGERHDRHRTGKPEYRLRAGLQSDGRLRRLAKSGVSAGVYSAAGRLFAGQRGGWRICLWNRCGDRRLAVGMGASGVASRSRPRRRGSLQPYQREPGRDPVRGLASTAPCRGGPAFSSAGGAGRTAAASGAPAGDHLRLAECHDAWSSGAPLAGARVPAAARFNGPDRDSRSRARRSLSSGPPPRSEAAFSSALDSIRGEARSALRASMRRTECAAKETSAGCLTSSTSTCWRR